MGENKKQVVQPEVTRAKFDSEINKFRLLESENSKRGIICLKAEFPVIELAFTAYLLKPPAIVFAVSIDFTNYDVEPPSIVFIDPFTRKPVTTKEVHAKFIKTVLGKLQIAPGQFIDANIPQNILVGEPNERPFICLPGVREYHNHPQHTGNSWLLSRTKGEGDLAFLIDQLYYNSIPAIKSYNVNFTVSINQQFQ